MAYKTQQTYFSEAKLRGFIYRKYEAMIIDVETGQLIGQPKYAILYAVGRQYPLPANTKDAIKNLSAKQ